LASGISDRLEQRPDVSEGDLLYEWSIATLPETHAQTYPSIVTADRSAKWTAQLSADFESHGPVVTAKLAALPTALPSAFQPTHGTAQPPAFVLANDAAVSSGLQRVCERGGVLLPVLECGSDVVRGSASV